MDHVSIVELFAGKRPDGSPVAERLQVIVQDDDSVILVRSPAFIKGLAKGDKIKLNRSDNSFELLKRSGNLCVKVIAKEDLENVARDLIPIIEKMGGELDIETERMLVFSIHVSCGFAQIEKVLNNHVGEESESAWFYGNVYDPQDGVTPLKWWDEILKPQ